MKKIISLVLLTALSSATYTAFAETKKVECSIDTAFETNKCEVCYEDTYAAKESPTGGWTSKLTEVVVPWEHNGGELDEIIYDSEQKKPEIKTSLTFTTQPETPEDLWENHETLIWKPFDDHKEFVIKAGEKVGLYRIAQDASINVSGTGAEDSIMFVTPLTVGSFNSATNEETEPKTRNICVRGKFEVEKPEVNTGITPPAEEVPEEEEALEEMLGEELESVDTAEAIETAIEAEEEVPEELNSAEPEPVVTATPEQSATQAGPEMWIFMILAMIFAGSFQAWKKQWN